MDKNKELVKDLELLMSKKISQKFFNEKYKVEEIDYPILNTPDNVYKRKLFSLIKSLLERKVTVTEFTNSYYYFLLEDVPYNALSFYEYELFSEIHEKLDWTDVTSDKEHSKYGWVNHSQFIDFVEETLHNFLKKQHLQELEKIYEQNKSLENDHELER